MKATQANFLSFLKKSQQFSIPIFQRMYSWDEIECGQLWKDIIRSGSDKKISSHFLGSIVYIEKDESNISDQSPYLVIDGQQRLTTITLLLEALARHVGDNEPINGFSADKIREYYLLNRLEKEDSYFKLLLTQTDKESLQALLRNKKFPSEVSIRVKDNFEFFTKQIEKLGEDLSSLCNGLAKLVIVDVSLTRGQDNPQLIFESMNSTGRELSQADLIRNFILMGLEPERQANLYKDYWRPMEVGFGQEAYGEHFDRFMRHYLTIKTGEIPNIDRVYEAFKNHANSTEISSLGVEALLGDLRIFADYYCRIALGKEPVKVLIEAFHDLREFKVDTAYPFLMEVYGDFVSEKISENDFLGTVRLVESYVFRRAICNIPTNSLNKTFATLYRSLDQDHFLESLQAEFLQMPSYRRFPDDEEFKREFKVRDLYNFPRRSYWLRRMENYNHKEKVQLSDYTIEHILPQNQDLSVEWRRALGSEWKAIQNALLHTPGNLTLTGYNSEYSDRPFKEKRDMPGGFKHSPILLNAGLGEIEEWNEQEIEKRAEKLANLAVRVWEFPHLSPEVIESYKRTSDKKNGYSISNHPNLSEKSLMRPLFEILRKQVLALDPVVVEEFFKQHIAYKAETNFLVVVARGKKLRLTLFMNFLDLNDPRRICRDISSPSTWGNENIEFFIDSEDDLPYAMKLISQSFEKQIGNGENE